MDLKRKGIEFPTPSDEDLLLVQSRQVCHLITFLLELTTIQPAPAASPVRPASSASSSSASSRGSKVQGPRSPVGPPNRREEQAARLPASGQLTQGQLRKLERDLEIAQRNMEVFSELLTELQPGQEHPEDRRLLLDVSATCREMQARVLELVGLVQHRDLTASLLELNDQMNNQLLRFERYKNNTSAEIGAAKSPGSSDEAFSPDEVLSLTQPAPAAASACLPAPGNIPTLTRTGATQDQDFHEIEVGEKEAKQ